MNKNGEFFTTNKNLLDFFCNLLPINEFEVEHTSILEPSSGECDIILAILNKISNKKCFLQNLTINEINKTSLDNSLRRIESEFGHSQLINKMNTDFIFEFNSNKKYDYIIGNPPYISYYGRRGQKKTESFRENVLNTYKQYEGIKNGKINSTQLFIEKSLNLLKNDNSKIIFIVDGNFNETAYIPIRRYIFNNGFHISKIVKNISEFENVASGQLIIEISKIKDELETLVIDYVSNEQFVTKYNSLDFINSDYTYSLNKQDDSIINVLNKIKDKTKSYLDLYPAKTLRTCTMLLNLENEFVVDKNNIESDNEFFYYVGSKSLKEKFCDLDSHKVLVFDKAKADAINSKIKVELEALGIKNKKRIMLGDYTSFCLPKIFIRQSSNEIVATLDNKRSTANNSLYMICSNDKYKFTDRELLFLTGYLNSKWISLYAKEKNIIKNFLGKQPQIRVNDLRNLPIIFDEEIKNEIANITKQIYSSSIGVLEGQELIDNLLERYFLN